MKILMCAPTFFDVEYDINPWMTENLHKVDKIRAREQWVNLMSIIEDLGHTVELANPVDGLPDMVFTANAATVFPTRDVVVSNFAKSQRRPETRHWRDFFDDLDYETHELPVAFEGAGDALMDSEGHLWMGYGFRTDKDAAKYLKKFTDTVIPLNLVNQSFYHLDTAFCPLSDGTVIYYPGAFSVESRTVIQKYFGNRAIAVSDEDANAFSCNAVNIGKNIILNHASRDLKLNLFERGFTVVENPMSEFMKSGGSCKCLTLVV